MQVRLTCLASGAEAQCLAIVDAGSQRTIIPASFRALHFAYCQVKGEITGIVGSSGHLNSSFLKLKVSGVLPYGAPPTESNIIAGSDFVQNLPELRLAVAEGETAPYFLIGADALRLWGCAVGIEAGLLPGSGGVASK